MAERTPPGRTPKPSAKSTKRKRRASPEVARRRAVVRGVFGTVVIVGLLFAFVYPTRTFLDQRADTRRARAQLELLQSENERLAREAERLRSDAEIERRARRYGLVHPGERPFVIIPAPTVAAPAAPPTPEGSAGGGP